ncbi:MAG: hypothetical protein R3327_03150 [Nitrosopumilaceae archaeon]|nr:hypothetical protein [Nitrosopumilaceae archaeon]
MAQQNDFDCTSVLNLDEGIRFVGVCSKNGLLLDFSYRDEINPLLATDDLKLSIQNTIIKHNIRIQEAEKMGEPIYSITTYQNVKRATISLDEELLLLVSFESNRNEHELIHKILKYIKKSVHNKNMHLN